MDTQKSVVDRINQANNVLVTVNSNPTVDQLAACIGLTVALNKIGKHATAVFSGKTPSTIEFLKPEETIEENTDSLRDFIISLDKSKADKLRYKVVDDSVVKIFITPYRTSITERDFEYSQGDFNVDVVVALGVHDQKELDRAITAHGRILHDATVVTINNEEQGGELGTLNWLMKDVSSLSEMAALLVTDLSDGALDEQIATALLTGIVSETERFSNDKTSANTMNISAALISAGANQQLVATKLEETAKSVASEPKTDNNKPSNNEDTSEKNDTPKESAHIRKDGTLEINHDYEKEVAQKREERTEEVKQDRPVDTPANTNDDQPTASHDDSTNNNDSQPAAQSTDDSQNNDAPAVTRHYSRASDTDDGAPFTSLTDPNAKKSELHIDPLSLPPVNNDAASADDRSNVTLHDLEKEVNSPHLQTPDAPAKPQPSAMGGGEELNLNDLQPPAGIDATVQEPVDPQQSIDAARDAVAAAVSGASTPPKALESLNAQPLGEPLHANQAPQQPLSPQPVAAPAPSAMTPSVNDIMQQGQSPEPTSEQQPTMPLPMPPQPQQPSQNTGQNNSSEDSAPPVPPPIVPPFPGQ